jgi:hypothetical protein
MRKRPENSWRQANSEGIWRKFDTKTESNVLGHKSADNEETVNVTLARKCRWTSSD